MSDDPQQDKPDRLDPVFKAILNGLSGVEKADQEINRARTIPLHIADQAVQNLEVEILRLRAQLERAEAQVRSYRSKWIRARAALDEVADE